MCKNKKGSDSCSILRCTQTQRAASILHELPLHRLAYLVTQLLLNRLYSEALLSSGELSSHIDHPLAQLLALCDRCLIRGAYSWWQFNN